MVASQLYALKEVQRKFPRMPSIGNRAGGVGAVAGE